MTSHSDLGRQAARDLWRLGLDASPVDDPLTPEFARAALAELEELQRGTPGVLKQVLEGAQMSAEQLNVESFHGLIEIVQNADDLRATEVRVAIRQSGKQRHLLVAHNGERVQLRHVIAMTLAFVSTKREDPRAKGRFGIGLKTLRRLGDVLRVHCAPYDFNIEGNHVRGTNRARAIPGFFNPSSSDTLLVLRLREGFEAAEFQSWFESLGAESLLFLDAVRSLRLIRFGRKQPLVHHHLIEVAKTAIKLPGIKEPCRRTILRTPRTHRSWTRFEISRKMPAQFRRRYKAREDTTPIGVAAPSQPERGQLYAGLPLGPQSDLPFSANAQFDIDVARRGIQHERLNSWLLEQFGDLIAGVALHRLANEPSEAWSVIPLTAEAGFAADGWVASRMSSLVEVVLGHLRRRFRLHVGGDTWRLKQLAYEDEQLEELLTQAEIDGLRPSLTLLPGSVRDQMGRWRAVLQELGGATLVDVEESLRLLDWDDKNLGPRHVKWFIRLARAAIEADLGTTLWQLRSVLAADGRRIVPPMAHVEGELLLRRAESNSLAVRLGLAHVVDPAYLSDSVDARIVRAWLEEHEMLRDVADPESTLKALAARDQDADALPINDDDLRLLRDAFASLQQPVRQQLAREVGRVIGVDIQMWEKDARVTKPGRPSDAYLPASIEDRKDGWSKAAGRSPGIAWIHPRYEDVLRRQGRRRAGSDEPRPLAARSLFTLLGAEVAPRLREPGNVETRYSDPASRIIRESLAEPQLEELQRLNRYATHLKRDHLSPDLAKVLKDLKMERGLRRHRERARALFRTLQRDWDRVFAGHTEATAVYSSSTWQRAGVIPASWLALLMGEPWLTSEDGRKKPPREVAIRTPATEAIYGDNRSLFMNWTRVMRSRRSLGLFASRPIHR
jgi:hypothetical protein